MHVMHAKFQIVASAVLEIGGGPKIQKWVPLPSVWENQDQEISVTQCPMGPQECLPQTASWSVQPFLDSEAELSRVTDDTTNIGNNSLHLMHLMQPKNPRKKPELHKKW